MKIQKDKAYSLLNDLIFKGFLTTEMNLSGIPVILKTINEKEFDMIRIYTGSPNKTSYRMSFDIYYIIFSILIFNNENILMTREKKISELYEYFSHMPRNIFQKIIIELNKLMNLSYDATKFIEGFSYTNRSRSVWKILGGNFANSEEFTGISGTKQLGLNVHQETWSLMNKNLDEEERYNQNFSLALLVASASNPKGVRKIRSQYDARVKNSSDRRERLAKIGYIDKTQWNPEGWAAPVDKAEELVAELERQMHGVKDNHDKFIEKHLQKLREKAEQKTKESEQRIKEIRKQRDPDDDKYITSSQRILSPSEMTDLMNKKNKKLISVASEEKSTEEDRDNFLKKVGAKVLTGRR